MWRSYSKGEREFCGIKLKNDLKKDQKLDELLITPSTKGVLTGLSGIPEADDVNITRTDILNNYKSLNFKNISDIDHYEKLLKEGFEVINSSLAKIDQIFVDTKFEFGYVKDDRGNEKLIYMDEVGTPDSSRIWDGPSYRKGKIIENSKEVFRQLLLNHFPDSDILLNKDRISEREALARDSKIPKEALMKVSRTYAQIAEKITGEKILLSENPKAEIIEVLDRDYGLIV